MQTIQDALQKEVDSYVDVRAMCLRTISIQKSPRYIMKAVIADMTTSTTLTSYNPKLQERLQGATGLILCNAINKRNGIVATSRTLAGITNPFVIPEDIKTALEGDTLPIATAMNSPEGKLCSIRAKVSEVITPPFKKMCYGTPRTFSEVHITDQSGSTSMALWGECAENIKEAQIIHVTNVRVKLFNEEKKLSSTPGSMKEEVDDAALKKLQTTASERSAVCPPKQCTVLAILDADPFLACPKKECANATLESRDTPEKIMMYCKSHLGFIKTTNANFSVTATLLLEVEKKSIVLKAKMPILEKMLGKTMKRSFDQEDITNNLLGLVNVAFKYSSFRGYISQIL